MEVNASFIPNKETIDINNLIKIKENIKLVKNNNLYFLMNLKNGAVISVNSDIYDKLYNYFETSDRNCEIDSYFNDLENLGFFENYEYRGQAYLHITDRCNLNCIGCYSAIDNRNETKDMDIQDIKTIFKELKKNKVVQIIYSGGEPTLRKDLSLILKIAKEEFNFTNILISNGRKEISKDVLKYLDELSLSIDDFKKKVNELGRTINSESIINNIKNCKSINLPVNGIITIHEKNVYNTETYFEISKKYKLPISFSIFYPTNKNEILNNKFILTDKGLKQMIESTFVKGTNVIEEMLSTDNIYCRDTCEVGKTNISVNSRGDLNPCHMLPDINLGNLLNDASSTWDNLKLFSTTNINEDEECNSCDFKYFCGAGCRSRSYYNKSLESKDPYCSMYKLYYKKLLCEIANM